MKLNKLLERQIGKLLSSDCLNQPEIKKLLEVVSESYDSYEKKLELTEHAFRQAEMDYVEINSKLSHEIDVKQKSLSSMLEEVDEELADEFVKSDVGLLVVADYLKAQLSARKQAEKIFAALIDSDETAVLIRDLNGKILHVNQRFLDLFSIPCSPEEVILKENVSFGEAILRKVSAPEKFYHRFRQILDEKKLVLKEKINFNDGRTLERDFIPIFIDGIFQGHLWKYEDKTELYSAKEEIQDFRLSNEMILNASLDGIVILDEDNKVEFWNPQAEKIFGWNESEVIHTDLQSILRLAGPVEAGAGNIRDFLGKVNNNTVSRIFELNVFNKTGVAVPIELFVLKIRQKNRFEYWCFFRDISERRLNEQRLLESQRLLKQCQEIAHIGSWEVDARTKKVQWTEELYNIRGIIPGSKESSVSLFEKYIHPDDLQNVNILIDESISAVKPFNIKYRIIREDGEIRILQDIGHPIADEHGNIIKIQGTSQDITEQERISEDLTLQKQFTDDILNHLPADIAVFDPQHNYLFINPNGVANEELRKWMIGKNDFDYCREKNVSEVMAVKRRHIFNEAVSTGQTQEWIDEHNASGGQKRFILRKLFPYHEKGRLKYVFGYGVDITERQKAEERLSRALQTVNKTNQELDRFAYVASHDLQEPLRMVSNFLNLLEMKIGNQLDDTSRQYINFALDGADRMKHLIQALLQYSRFGYSRESFSETDLNGVVKEVLHVMGTKINEKNATVTFGPMPCLSVVKTQIIQLFQNLVSNALKYNTDPSPRVEIMCTELPDHWQFSFKDNGIGIDPKYFEKIFVIFQRLHSRFEYSGTGIGLSICAKIVEQHNGQIWVDSEPDKGSTFFFTLAKRINRDPDMPV